ncbi:MAG: hypothetical protein EOO77_43635, partial [Oxalobacteraceae bacterium]
MNLSFGVNLTISRRSVSQTISEAKRCRWTPQAFAGVSVEDEAMKKRTALSIAAGMSLITTAPAPASTKPCRSKDGRIIE